MTEVTEEARAELDAIIASLPHSLRHPLYDPYHANNAMLALDRHHNRTPPDPMVAKADALLCLWSGDKPGYFLSDPCFPAFVEGVKRIFPDG